MAKGNPADSAAGMPPDDKRCVSPVRNKTSGHFGERCPKWAMKGTTQCRQHGGNAPATQRKKNELAAKTKILTWAAKEARKAGRDIDPHEHLVNALFEAEGMMAYYGSFIGSLDEGSQADVKGGIRGAIKYSLPTDELDELAVSNNEMLITLNRHGEAQIHPFVEQYNQWWDRRQKAAKDCVGAGISERRVQLKEQEASLIVLKFRTFATMMEQILGVPITTRPDFPGLVRQALLEGDVVE